MFSFSSLNWFLHIDFVCQSKLPHLLPGMMIFSLQFQKTKFWSLSFCFVCEQWFFVYYLASTVHSLSKLQKWLKLAIHKNNYQIPQSMSNCTTNTPYYLIEHYPNLGTILQQHRRSWALWFTPWHNVYTNNVHISMQQ